MTGTKERGWRFWALAIAAAYCIAWVASFSRSPNWDEVWLIGHTFSPIAEQLRAIRSDLAHPPGPYLLFRAWFAAFGTTELAARVLVALIALATLILYARLAFLRVAHPVIAILGFGSLYLRIGSVATLFRGYGLLLFAVVACLSCWDAWNRTGRDRWLIGVAAATVVAVYSHYFGVLLVGTLGVVELVTRRRLMAFVTLAVSSISLLPWMVVVVPEYMGGSQQIPESVSWAANYGLLHGVKEVPNAFLTGVEAGNDPFGHFLLTDDLNVAMWLRRLSWLLLGSLGILALVGRYSSPPHGAEGFPSRRFEHVLWVAVPGLALLALSVVTEPLFHPRFLVGAWPVAWLLVADLGFSGGRPARIVAGLAVVLALTTAGIVSLQQLTPSPVRSATREVARSWSPGDALVADTAIAAHVFWEWRGVLHRQDEVRAVRTGGIGEPVPREARGQNVLPYRDLSALEDTGAGRIWAFCSRPASCDRIVQRLSTAGYRVGSRRAASRGQRRFEVLLFLPAAPPMSALGGDLLQTPRTPHVC